MLDMVSRFIHDGQPCFSKHFLTKSWIVYSIMTHPGTQRKISAILKMRSWENQGGRNKAGIELDQDRVLGKMEGWKEVLLNQAGKEVLIKFVIQAIPTYAMAIVKFPKSFCRNMNANVARFWW